MKQADLSRTIDVLEHMIALAREAAGMPQRKVAPGPTVTLDGDPQPTEAKPRTAAEQADDAFTLLQSTDVLAGVFRRQWNDKQLLAIVEELIKGGSNVLALAKIMHRIRPFVLTYFEEYVDGQKYKLRSKPEAQAPSLEEIVPAASLVEA